MIVRHVATPQRTTIGTSESLLNRELSWLALNERVLELAADPDEPLLERVKFCSIFSTNLDEFFMVRVAGLLDQIVARLPVRSPDGRTPQETLAEIHARALDLTRRQSQLWRAELCPALAAEGIAVGTVDDAGEAELAELETRFAQQIYPVLTPLAVGPGQPFPYISGLSLSLGVTVHDPETGEERFARVKVPETLPRFVAAGNGALLIPLENVISHYLGWLFPGMGVVERAAFRVTRDGDTEISDDADDLLEAVESELQRRRRAARGLELGQPSDARAADRPARRPLRRRLPRARAARPRRRRAALRARPARPEVRAVGAGHPAAARRAEGRRPLRRDRRVRHRRRAPLRLLRDERRDVRALRRARPGGRDVEDDRLPHEPRLGPRAGADGGGGV